MNKIITGLFVVVTLVSLNCLPAQEPRRMALVFGNSEYTSQVKLPNAVNDAEAISTALSSVGFTVTKKVNRTTKVQMKQDIDEFVESLEKNDACFVFYAGHGCSFEGANYLVPANAELKFAQHVEANCLEVKYLKDAMRYSPAGLKVIILDACRSEEVLPVKSRGGHKGMVKENIYDGMVIAFSTAPGEIALDGDDNNSPYTKYLVQTIASQNENGLTLTDWFVTTARLVKEETGQRPHRDTDDTLMDFYLKQPVKPKPGPPKPVPPTPATLVAPFSAREASQSQAAWAKLHHTQPVTTNNVGMKFSLIPPGEFMMGSPKSELGYSGKHEDDEQLHRVTLTQPFLLCQTEVTKGQFAEFVRDAGFKTEAEKDGDGGYGYEKNSEGAYEWKQDPKFSWKDPGFTQRDNEPVVNVSWNDAVAYCNWLSKKEGLPEYYQIGASSVSVRGGVGYRLPTEAEWEYACRAGSETAFQFGDDNEGLAQVGNVADASGKAKHNWSDTIAADDGYANTSPVGSFRANGFGLFDMHGNVWEWCWDWYGEYGSGSVDDPDGAGSGSGRVIRGGCWLSIPRFCRSALRDWNDPSYRHYNVGFRVASSPFGQDK